MKNIISKRLFAALALFILSVSVFAYAAADVSGKYKGTVSVEGPGTLDVTAEIKVEEGKYSGVIDSPQGSATIVSGKMESDKLTLETDFGGNAITFSGTVDKEGKISGTVTGAVTGTFEWMREKETR